ncbi:unnamed protein product [Parascedosporium putredinis]|uniref:Uncharacterized protein n=1 Tax=Parascedosporium putredinis TaxID=1442378 RepID=A0A9P1MEW4_9PEZI|nr:unnamed protein product [Parascedosporium putredinis]CAI8002258.1 unnamed protein product [Parascedosporium putredinis]
MRPRVQHVREAKRCTLNYVIPISDNGGSTSEVIRVFGGPGIGDVRSRLVRLIPENGSDETVAIRQFFNHRLPKSVEASRAEWADIVEGVHPSWEGISSRQAHAAEQPLRLLGRERRQPLFDGARLFTGSFEAAIHLFSSVCNMPDKVTVLPALNSNFAHHIAAMLANGDVITGQNDISHPSVPTAAVPSPNAALYPAWLRSQSDTEEHDKVEDANLPGTLPALRKPAISFSKDQEEELPARIGRVWYINPYGQEIRIAANPRVVQALEQSDSVVYSIGSLFTSLIPNLVLKGVGDVIATNPAIRSKVLILNGTLDRETGPSSDPFTALDFVAAIARACSYSRGKAPPSEDEYSLYVTHVIYLEGPSSPVVDKKRFENLSIETTRLYGPSRNLASGVLAERI